MERNRHPQRHPPVLGGGISPLGGRGLLVGPLLLVGKHVEGRQHVSGRVSLQKGLRTTAWAEEGGDETHHHATHHLDKLAMLMA